MQPENRVTYRDFCDARHRAEEKADADYRSYLTERFERLDRAVSLANAQLERRLDLLNEFRAQSLDEQDRFATREVMDSRLDGVIERLNRTERWQAGMEGKFAMISVGGGILIVVVNVVLRFV